MTATFRSTIEVALIAAVLLGGNSSSTSSAASAAEVTVLSGTISIEESLTVPANTVLRVDPSKSTTIEINGNLIVEGVLEMKPAAGVVHTLRFVGVDEGGFVGGGMNILESDRGLWVVGAGRLDIQGTRKVGWNRTGTDPTWSSADELLVAPTAGGDFGVDGFKRFSLGGAVPRVDPSLPPAEVINLTRNVNIEGTPSGRAHVLIMSTSPQTIRYAAFRHLGPRQPAEGRQTVGVAGRYPIHFHHAGDGARGSIVEGNVIRDSGNRGIVPHHSNGITVRDNVAYDVYETPYWWDHGDEHASHDIIYDHNFAGRILDDPAFRGFELSGFELGRGSNNVASDNVAVGVLGNKNCSGFKWPSQGSGLWSVSGNVAHNNKCNGIFVWQNTGAAHLIKDFVAYRNGFAGVSHGAYQNDYLYSDLYLFENQVTGVALHAFAGAPEEGRTSQTWTCVTVAGSPVAVMIFGSPAPNGYPVEFDQLSTASTPELVVLHESATTAGHDVVDRASFSTTADCDAPIGNAEAATDPAPSSHRDGSNGASGAPQTTTDHGATPSSADRGAGATAHNAESELHPDPVSTTVAAETAATVVVAASGERPDSVRPTAGLYLGALLLASAVVAVEVRRRRRENPN